jgi:peptide chain release factor 2
MNVLAAKLLSLKQQEKSKEKNALKGEHKSAQWGNQIRSYVLHPYQMVKDHRTGYETSNTAGVLDGDLNRFIEEYLKQH